MRRLPPAAPFSVLEEKALLYAESISTPKTLAQGKLRLKELRLEKNKKGTKSPKTASLVLSRFSRIRGRSKMSGQLATGRSIDTKPLTDDAQTTGNNKKQEGDPFGECQNR